MKNITVKLLALPLAILLATPAWGQSEGLEGTLRQMVKENAEGYLQPMVTAFGTGVNNGIFRIARPHKILGFDLTLNASFTAIPEAAQTYDFFIPSTDVETITFDIPGYAPVDVSLNLDTFYEQDRTVSTFFGPEFGSPDTDPISPDRAAVEAGIRSQLSDGGIPQFAIDLIAPSFADTIAEHLPDIEIGGVVNTSAFPMIMPQIGLGLPFGIELTFRGLPVEVPLDDSSSFSFSGYGIKIGLNRFIPTIPLVFPALSIGYYATNLNVADFITLNSSIISLQASKTVPFLTVYGGLGIENSKLVVDVTDLPLLDTNIEISGTNKLRFTVGGRLKLALLSINYDYNGGEYAAHNIGIGLTLR